MLTEVKTIDRAAMDDMRARLLELIERDEAVREVLVRLLSEEKTRRVFV